MDASLGISNVDASAITISIRVRNKPRTFRIFLVRSPNQMGRNFNSDISTERKQRSEDCYPPEPGTVVDKGTLAIDENVSPYDPPVPYFVGL